jgi:malate dehydrogenase
MLSNEKIKVFVRVRPFMKAEIGKVGIRKVVESALTDSEVASLKEAAEAVRAKQADVQTL